MSPVRSLAVLAVGSVALLTACQSAPPPVEKQRWIRLETPHFEMWSAVPLPASRALIEDLERLRSVLAELASIEVGDASTRIVAFGDSVAFAEFAFRPEGRSFALSTLDGPVLVLDASSEGAGTALRHAFVHASLRMAGEPNVPPWYEEGLATYVAQVELSNDGFELGRIPPRVANWLRFSDPLPLRRVLGARASRLAWSEGELGRFGAQSWALLHLLRSEPQLAQGERHEVLTDTIRRALHRQDAEDATASAYEEVAQAEWAAYLRSESFPTFHAASAVPPAPNARQRAVPTAAALEVLAQLAEDLGRGDPLVARLHAGALRARPEQADPERARSALETALRDPDADPAAIAATLRERETNEPADADDWTRLGDDWRTLAARDPALAREPAMAAYRRALALDPNHPGAGRGLAAAFGPAWEEHAAAAALLQRVAANRPGVPQVELALAAHLTGAGQAGRAALVLARLARAPHVGNRVDPGALETAMERAGTSLGKLEGQLWESQLLLRTPRSDADLEQMAPWVEVSGSAGVGESPLHDVVVAFDLSAASFLPSGLDVNGNGRIGRRIEPIPGFDAPSPRTLITDRGDSIQAALRWVGAELVEQLDPASTRVAVVGYGRRPFMVAPFGPPEAAVAALDAFQPRVRLQNGSSLSTALLGSLALLQEEDRAGRPRRSTILLLAGLKPLHPNPRRAKTQATETAQLVGQLGVRVHTYAVGLDAADDVGPLLSTLSTATGGSHAPVLDVTAVALPDMGLRLSGLEAVEIRNLTSDDPARAQRVFADGSFDAMVPLVPGENVIEVVARPEGRAPLRETRRVVYTAPDEPTEQHRRRAAVLLWKLRNRSIEVATRLDIADAQAARAGTGSTIPEAPPLQRTEVTIAVVPEPEAEVEAADAATDGLPEAEVADGEAEDPEVTVSSAPPEAED